MKKQNYFRICMTIIISSSIITTLAFLYMNKSPVAFALDVETYYVNEEDSKDIPYARIPIAYFAPTMDSHSITRIQIETDRDDVELYAPRSIQVNDQTNFHRSNTSDITRTSYGFYTLYEILLGINIEKLDRIEGPIHIISMNVEFSNGKTMDIPIKQATLLPLRGETFTSDTITECPAFTIVQRHIDHPVDMQCVGEKVNITQPYLKKDLSFFDVLQYIRGGGSL